MRKKLGVILLICIVLLNGCSGKTQGIEAGQNDVDDAELEYSAETTPYGKYPELITYTLGKMTGTNNSNMPEGDTYENNAYTRYIRDLINVENQDVFEDIDTQYDTTVSMAMAAGNLPDIMVVSDYEDLQRMVENDMIEDLSESYENCTSDRIKEIYGSYGPELMDMVTFDDKIMAIPETNIDNGPNLVWLRQDWMDALGLTAPKTLDDVETIVKAFVSEDPGHNGVGNTVGLVCDTQLSGEEGYSGEYLLDLIFAKYGAFPKQWIRNEQGDVVYGSVTQEAQNALEHIHGLYEDGILDQDFLLRTTSNIIELITQGKCGSFFGPWWAPNNPLIQTVGDGSGAKWRPYLISTDENGDVSYHSQNPSYKFVVVRKGYEHPEIAAKIVSIMFDKIRYECDDSEEFIRYYQLNVDPTARPFAINVDYNNALGICYQELKETLEGSKQESELKLLEDSYYQSCKAFLGTQTDLTDVRTEATPDQWAAYTSRIEACSLISDEHVKKVQSLFFGTTDTIKTEWWKLKDKEEQAYLKIVCGEEPLSYFQEFVEDWYEEGGQQITEEVTEIVQEEE